MVKVFDRFGNPRVGSAGSSELVVSYLESATIPSATVASADEVMVFDQSDAFSLKRVTAQSIADLGGGGGGGVSDGNKGDIEVTGGGTIWTFNVASVTSAGRAVISAADAPAQRTALSLGDSATLNVGTTAGTVAAGNHNHSGVYEPAGTAASAVSAHVSDLDPHTQYQLMTARAAANGYAPLDSNTRLAHTYVDVPSANSILGVSGTAGAATLISCTAAGRAIIGAADAPAQRTALSLGGSATLNVGTTAGTVAAGDHNHSGVYDTFGSAASAVSAHESAPDPHPGYQLESQKDVANGYAGLDASAKFDYRGLKITDGNFVLGSSTGSTSAVLHPYTAAGMNMLNAADAPAQRTLLSLGDSATLNVGTTAGTVAAGNHNHSGVYDTFGSAASAVATHESNADPHTGYIKADGTRAFTAVVSGVTPTSAAHLATKGYVDGVGGLQWIDYVSMWDFEPTEISPGVWSYIWDGVTRYRYVPDPYVASDDSFYSDVGLTTIIAARGS